MNFSRVEFFRRSCCVSPPSHMHLAFLNPPSCGFRPAKFRTFRVGFVASAEIYFAEVTRCAERRTAEQSPN